MKIEDRFEAIRNSSAEGRVDLYLCSLYRPRPDDSDFATMVAEGGQKEVKPLLSAIFKETDAYRWQQLIYALRLLSTRYYDVSGNKEVIGQLRESIGQIEDDFWRTRAHDELNKILAGPTRPQPETCRAFWKLTTQSKIEEFRAAPIERRVDWYVCLAEESRPPFPFIRPLLVTPDAAAIPLLLRYLEKTDDPERMLWILEGIRFVCRNNPRASSNVRSRLVATVPQEIARMEGFKLREAQAVWKDISDSLGLKGPTVE